MNIKINMKKKINFDEVEYERNQLKQVWSVSKNPFSKKVNIIILI